jgi:alkylation response protein AidB-like acyl-CoA dehydrogenase
VLVLSNDALRGRDRIAAGVQHERVTIDIDDLAARCGQRDAAKPEQYPAESLSELHASGFIRAPFTQALGGSGWSLPDSVRAIETLASHSASAALISSMPLGLAGIYALGAEAAPDAHRPAWGDQIDAIAARFRTGIHYAACNSEKGAGGSLAATQTVARKDGAEFRLSGEKILASGGKYAGTFFSTAKVDPADLPGAGIVELFFVETHAPGVLIQDDWDGFGMRPTESQTVRYDDAPGIVMGFPDFIATVQPLQYWFCLFAAIPLGCARTLVTALGDPSPASPALRLRLTDALMRYESLRAYLLETAAGWRAGAGPAYAARVMRTKSYVAQESTRLCAELFALSGGRHYRRNDSLARALADSFAGTALRPPLPLALDVFVENFDLGELGHPAV